LDAPRLSELRLDLVIEHEVVNHAQALRPLLVHAKFRSGLAPATLTTLATYPRLRRVECWSSSRDAVPLQLTNVTWRFEMAQLKEPPAWLSRIETLSMDVFFKSAEWVTVALNLPRLRRLEANSHLTMELMPPQLDAFVRAAPLLQEVALTTYSSKLSIATATEVRGASKDNHSPTRRLVCSPDAADGSARGVRAAGGRRPAARPGRSNAAAAALDDGPPQ
jgi:hypothetical protein